MDDLPEELLKEAQDIVRLVPTLIVGSGHSCAYGLPSMRDIATYLISEMPNILSDVDAIRLWNDLVEPIAEDLESGLNRLNSVDPGVDELLLGIRQLVTRLFQDRCAKAERLLLSEGILSTPESVPLLRLIKKLYTGCSPNCASIDVITPNYDTLIELFCDAGNLPAHTGFVGYRFRWFNPGSLQNPVHQCRLVSDKGKVKRNFSILKTVRILKPHGSVNWVIRKGQPSEMLAYQNSEEGGVIIPGPFKYRDALVNNLFDEIRMMMNKVLKSTQGVIAIGYGFNDDHLQNVLEDRLASGMPMLILTKGWTPNIERVLKHHEHVVAFQKHGEGSTCAWRGNHLRLSTPVWQLDSFLKEVIE